MCPSGESHVPEGELLGTKGTRQACQAKSGRISSCSPAATRRSRRAGSEYRDDRQDLAKDDLLLCRARCPRIAPIVASISSGSLLGSQLDRWPTPRNRLKTNPLY